MGREERWKKEIAISSCNLPPRPPFKSPNFAQSKSEKTFFPPLDLELIDPRRKYSTNKHELGMGDKVTGTVSMTFLRLLLISHIRENTTEI